MMIRKGSVLLILSFFLAVNGFAQYTEDEGGIESPKGYLRYLGLGAGATYQVMNDAAISPIVYSRVGAQPMLSQMKVSTTIFSELQLKASLINLTHQENSKENKVYVKNKRATIDYRFALKMPIESRNFDIRAGAIVSGMFANKTAPHLIDAYKVYEYAASVGLYGRIIREFSAGDKAAFIIWDLGIPVLANVSRPFYLNREEAADPDNKPISDFLGNSSTGTFGKYFRLASRLSYMYRLENGNIIQLSYQWDYSKIKTINKVYFAEHIVSLLFMFNY